MKTMFKPEWIASPACRCLALVAVFCAVQKTGAQVINQPPNPVIIQPVTQPIELGPVMDVLPHVLSDGFTINLTLVPSVRQFDGYDTQPNIPMTSQANTVVVPMVLPKFNVRQVITTVNVWDGQTVVLGGLIREETQKIKDKVPVLGDLPLVGRLFRSESSVNRKSNLLVFVTPTIIDPAGNKLHSEEEMPFTQSTIPSAQPPGTQIAAQPGAQPEVPPTGGPAASANMEGVR